jgi:hypothetical protein
MGSAYPTEVAGRHGSAPVDPGSPGSEIMSLGIGRRFAFAECKHTAADADRDEADA